MKHNHKLFIDIAERISQESSAVRLNVGAVIAKDGSIIDFGYNGTPAGWETNICEIETVPNEFESNAAPILVTKPEVVHAEMNALMKCAKLGKSVNGAILYITHAPCSDCAKHILSSGIKEVYYKHVYRSESGLNILRLGGIKIINWSKTWAHG